MAGASPPLIAVRDHPRAGPAIRRAKGYGGIVGVAVAGLASWRHGLPLGSVELRALIGGITGYVVAWAGAVSVWRHIVVAETRATVRQAVERRNEQLAEQRRSR